MNSLHRHGKKLVFGFPCTVHVQQPSSAPDPIHTSVSPSLLALALALALGGTHTYGCSLFFFNPIHLPLVHITNLSFTIHSRTLRAERTYNHYHLIGPSRNKQIAHRPSLIDNIGKHRNIGVRNSVQVCQQDLLINLLLSTSGLPISGRLVFSRHTSYL